MQKEELLQVQQPFACDITKHNVIEVTICVHTINGVITLCMKLIAFVPGLLFGREPDETCCHSVVTSTWLKTQVCSAG